MTTPTGTGPADPAPGDDLDEDGRLHHAVRGRVTVAVGEVELVLAEPGVPDDVRAASAQRVLAALAEVEALLARRAATTTTAGTTMAGTTTARTATAGTPSGVPS